MNKRPQPPCPECEKLSEVSSESNIIGQFLEWLYQDKDYSLCYYEGGKYGEMILANTTIEKLLAEYFGIDMNKVEQERMALLEWVREQGEDE